MTKITKTKLGGRYMVVSEYDCDESATTLEQAQEIARTHFDNKKDLEEVTIYKLVGAMRLHVEFENR